MTQATLQIKNIMCYAHVYKSQSRIQASFGYPWFKKVEVQVSCALAVQQVELIFWQPHYLLEGAARMMIVGNDVMMLLIAF